MFRKLTLTHWIFVGIALAIFVGLLTPVEGGWIDKPMVMAVAKPLGDIFLRLLKMIVVPLIFSSITVGVLGLGNSKDLGRLGGKTVLYYLTTSTISILIGLMLVNLINPGAGLNLNQDPSAIQSVHELGASKQLPAGQTGGVAGFLIRMIPANPVKAMADGDMLAVIFFSILLGLFITQLGDKHKQLMTDLFEAMFDVMMKMTRFVILLAPVGIFGLVAYQVAKQSSDADRFMHLFRAVAKFFIVVVVGLSLHAFVVLPLLVAAFGRIPNPYRHMRAMGKALLTAFSTASSNATLPLTMECVEENAGVSNKTTSFVLPLGATVNMDGTALYECVVVLFIAQAYNFDLTFTEQIVVVVTALLTSIGVAGVPMASLVAIVIIVGTIAHNEAQLQAYLGGIGLIMVTDRILDMMRTTVNVWSDSCGAVIIARSEGEKTKLVP